MATRFLSSPLQVARFALLTARTRFRQFACLRPRQSGELLAARVSITGLSSRSAEASRRTSRRGMISRARIVRSSLASFRRSTRWPSAVTVCGSLRASSISTSAAAFGRLRIPTSAGRSHPRWLPTLLGGTPGPPLRSLDWRREWDSNPRYGFPYTRFPSVRLKPLGHLSGARVMKAHAFFCKSDARRRRARAPQATWASLRRPSHGGARVFLQAATAWVASVKMPDPTSFGRVIAGQFRCAVAKARRAEKFE